MHLNSIFVLVGTTLLLIAVALVAFRIPACRPGWVGAMSVLRAE